MIEVKSAAEIEKMRESGRLARHVLDLAGRMVEPGVTTDEIDAAVHNEIIKVCPRSYQKLQSVVQPRSPPLASLFRMSLQPYSTVPIPHL